MNVAWSGGHFQRKRHLPTVHLEGDSLSFSGGVILRMPSFKKSRLKIHFYEAGTKECLEIHEWLEAKTENQALRM